MYQVQRRLQESGFMTLYIDLFGLSSADNIAKRMTKGVYKAIYQEKSVLQKAISTGRWLLMISVLWSKNFQVTEFLKLSLIFPVPAMQHEHS